MSLSHTQNIFRYRLYTLKNRRRLCLSTLTKLNKLWKSRIRLAISDQSCTVHNYEINPEDRHNKQDFFFCPKSNLEGVHDNTETLTWRMLFHWDQIYRVSFCFVCLFSKDSFSFNFDIRPRVLNSPPKKVVLLRFFHFDSIQMLISQSNG